MNLASRSLTPIICSATKFSSVDIITRMSRTQFFPPCLQVSQFLLQKFSSTGSYENPIRASAVNIPTVPQSVEATVFTLSQVS